MLDSPVYERQPRAPRADPGQGHLGRADIGDLAKMPHLLIAGTTGSGKSVGINTMILSILYRMPPERCKFIMVDPKMLELSVYDGIPHLLAPVVTDPRKAVLALKWTVREMENRYRKMSKLGVRNIDGYNTRLAELRQKARASSQGPDRLRSGNAASRSLSRSHSNQPTAADRRRRRRDGRPDAGRGQGDRGGNPASGADGASGRHPPDHGDPAAVCRRHHRHDQGKFPDPHQLSGDLARSTAAQSSAKAAPSSCSAGAICSTWPAAAGSPGSTVPSFPTRRSRRWCAT